MIQTVRSSFLCKRLYILSSILLLLPISATATSQHSEASEVIEHALQAALWEETEWLNLLHYNKEYNTYVSQVDDARYFYADDGKTNPKNELIASIKHLFIATDDHNMQTQCRFIARSEWLIEQLNINKTLLPVVQCAEYLEWYKMAEADTVTMIFPAYHLNSPSSMFGHTLLRLDKSGSKKSEWLSLAVNFGANIITNDNSIVYAYRGLVGGYPGIFITEPYFKKIQEYNRIEHRDIWEYELNLTPSETSRMIKHLWELKNINFDYYFFDENCSYRLLELLEVARPNIELTDEFILTAIPVDTVRTIEKAQLIKSISYRPARVTQIQHKLEQIPEQHRAIVIQLSDDINTAKSDDFTELTLLEQKNITDLAYNYLRYQNTKEASDSDIAKRSFQLLQLLNSYPADIDTSSVIPTPVSPEKSHHSKRIAVGVGKRLDNHYAEIGYKMSFHELEDNKDGFLQGAQINLGSIKLRAEDNVGIRLQELTLVDILSLTPRNDFFSPLSWKIYTGFERQLTNTKDQLTYHVTAGVGGTWEIVKNHQYYALAIARLETNRQLKNTIEPAIGFTTGFLSHFKHTTARLEVSGEHFEDEVYRLRAQYTQNIVLSVNHSIKLFAKHEWHENDVDFSDVNLSYQYYF